jgi:hypothetical protein
MVNVLRIYKADFDVVSERNVEAAFSTLSIYAPKAGFVEEYEESGRVEDVLVDDGVVLRAQAVVQIGLIRGVVVGLLQFVAFDDQIVARSLDVFESGDQSLVRVVGADWTVASKSGFFEEMQYVNQHTTASQKDVVER